MAILSSDSVAYRRLIDPRCSSEGNVSGGGGTAVDLEPIEKGVWRCAMKIRFSRIRILLEQPSDNAIRSANEAQQYKIHFIGQINRGTIIGDIDAYRLQCSVCS
jgi:hypothetical protein